MDIKHTQGNDEDELLGEDEEDLPFEVEMPESDSENVQNVQDSDSDAYTPSIPGEEWIEKAMAMVRVFKHVHHSAHDAEKEEQERTVLAKRAFLEIFRKNLGTISVTCDKANIGRQTYYLWMKTDPQFRSAIMQVEDERHDLVEDEIMQAILKHDGSMIRFYAERRMPEYKNKSTVDIVTGDKTFEDLLYSQAIKRKALAEANFVKSDGPDTK
jgi:hypothetical protein